MRPPNTPTQANPAIWSQLGDADETRRARVVSLLEDFYRRVFRDPMIGFLFRGKDAERLVRLEAQLAEELLGGPTRYQGRSMTEAHRRSPILGGHFARRQQLLREVLVDHDFPAEVAEAWLEHNETLRPQVTRDEGTDCDHRATSGDWEPRD